jgi:predicted SAM-dependent methyltransferase
MLKIYPNFSEPSFKNQALFEFASWYGRTFKINKSKISLDRKPLLLDLGVGENYTDGWVHADIFRLPNIKFWKRKTETRIPEIELDLRYPLNCPENAVDGVYSGHTLEHLYPNHAYQLLSEIYRVLKPNCWLRINVPDLKRAVDFYNGIIIIPEYKYRAEAISHYTQDWSHHSAWDEELLTVALELSGFINVRKVKFGKEGSDPRLIKEQEPRFSDTLVMEAQKPLSKKL